MAVVGMSKFEPHFSARLHGVRRALEDRARAASEGAKDSTYDMVGAMLRGKATAYREAIDLLDAVEKGNRLPRRLRWTDRRRFARTWDGDLVPIVKGKWRA